MTRRPIEAIELRYNLFRHKRQPDLYCAVPEHHPGLITGEQWEYGGTRKRAIVPPGLDPTGVEAGACPDSFHLFQTAHPHRSATTPGYSAPCAPLRRHSHLWLDNRRTRWCSGLRRVGAHNGYQPLLACRFCASKINTAIFEPV